MELASSSIQPTAREVVGQGVEPIQAAAGAAQIIGAVMEVMEVITAAEEAEVGVPEKMLLRTLLAAMAQTGS